jgi:hypothetical protein
MTANAGYHAYATGDVLTAAQVQYNLQNQTVMYFATSAARTTAIGSVTVEGMVSYIPANGLEYYNGSAWTGVSNPGDITAVNTAVTSGLTGGATSGAVDLSLLLNFNAQTGTTYTLVSTDLNKLVTTSNAAAVTVTVPPSVFSAGQQINVQSIGVGLTSFAQGAGVTITSTGATSTAPVLRARYSAATIICTAANTFTIVGDLT